MPTTTISAEPKCAYSCPFHKGKIEWHHPVANRPSEGDVGLYLCEAHHSLIKDRTKRYSGETIIDKAMRQMRVEIEQLEIQAVETAGLTIGDIDKW